MNVASSERAAGLVRAVEQLPALPAVVSHLVEMANDPDASAGDLSSVIGLDPALLTAILKLANSAYYGRSRTVGDVEAAIMLLGFDQVRDLALSLNVIATVEPRGPCAFSTRDFWKHSFLAGSLARALCRPLWRIYPSEHYVAGFLHDIGRLVLNLADPRAMRWVVAAVNGGEDSVAAERRVYQCDHAEVGALACRYWRLPERIVTAVANHHGAGLANLPTLADQDLVQIVHVADLLANRAGFGFTARRSRQKLLSPVRRALGKRHVALRRSVLAPLAAQLVTEVETTAQILALGQPQANQE